MRRHGWLVILWLVAIALCVATGRYFDSLA